MNSKIVTHKQFLISHLHRGGFPIASVRQSHFQTHVGRSQVGLESAEEQRLIARDVDTSVPDLKTRELEPLPSFKSLTYIKPEATKMLCKRAEQGNYCGRESAIAAGDGKQVATLICVSTKQGKWGRRQKP